MNEALRGYLAVRGIAASASVILNFETLPLYQRGRGGVEARPGAASGHAQDAHAPRDFAAAKMLRAQDAGDLAQQRRQRIFKQAGSASASSFWAASSA